MKIKELDVVLLMDGRKATVLEVYDNGYICEVTDEYGQTLDMPEITNDDIEKVLYRFQ